MDWGCELSRLTLRRASSLRFLKAWSAVAVWPLRPREVEILVQSSFRAAERWDGCQSSLTQARAGQDGLRSYTYSCCHVCGSNGNAKLLL